MFIGFFSLANSVTLFGLALSVTSCFLAACGNFKFAIYLLFLACICDMFDGKIARNGKKRSNAEVFYGIQLDSLCDVISFGVTPCFIAYSFGFKGTLDIIIYIVFIACGVTRLAYFNTLTNTNPAKASKIFRGVPIPMSVFVVTFLFMLTTFIQPYVSIWLFRIVYLCLGLAFVLKINIKKPDIKKGMMLVVIEIIMLLVLVIAPECQSIEASSDTQIEESSDSN